MKKFNVAICFLAMASLPMSAMSQECTFDYASEKVKERMSSSEAEDVVDAPLQAPTSKQESAVVATGSSASLVDGSDFNRLLGFAVNSGLATQSDDVVSFDLNLFAIKAMLDPSVIQIQKKYQEHSFLRRFSGSVSFGGKGDPVDQDGDGMVDEALQTKSLDDIVTLDLRFRLSSQSRDRRDKDNYEKIQQAVAKSFSDFNAAQNLIDTQLVASGILPGNNSYSCADVDEKVKSIDESFINELRKTAKQFDADYSNVIKGIDTTPLWTLAIGATERSTEFGADKWKIGIRGTVSGENQGWTVNLDHSVVDVQGMKDARMLRAGLEWKTNVLKSIGNGGVDTSISAAFEQFKSVPGAMHDEIAKINIKLDYPLTPTLKMPVSITWANHADLLTDESELRGNIGFTFDTDFLISQGLKAVN